MDKANALVLIIDDVEAIVDELLTLLQLHDIPAIGASALNQAIVLLESAPKVAVIVCDVRLDHESGLEIVSRIAGHDALRSRHFHYLFVTGDPMHIDHLPEALPGAPEHMILTKPVQPRELVGLFRELLTGSGVETDVNTGVFG